MEKSVKKETKRGSKPAKSIENLFLLPFYASFIDVFGYLQFVKLRKIVYL